VKEEPKGEHVCQVYTWGSDLCDDDDVCVCVCKKEAKTKRERVRLECCYLLFFGGLKNPRVRASKKSQST